MTLEERLESARYAIVEAERAVNELCFSVPTDDWEHTHQLTRTAGRTLRAMARMREQIDLANVTWVHDTAK